MRSFEECSRIGEIGENIVYKILKKQKNTLDVLDVRYESFFQDADIDFIHVVKDELMPRFIEVKTDNLAHKTGNFTYEFIGNVSTGSRGRHDRTLSTHIFIYLTKTNSLYMLKTMKLKNFVIKNKTTLRLINLGRNSKGYLLNINELIKEGVCINLGKVE